MSWPALKFEDEEEQVQEEQEEGEEEEEEEEERLRKREEVHSAGFFIPGSIQHPLYRFSSSHLLRRRGTMRRHATLVLHRRLLTSSPPWLASGADSSYFRFPATI